MFKKYSFITAALVTLAALHFGGCSRSTEHSLRDRQVLASSVVILATVTDVTSEPVFMDPYGGIYLAQLNVDHVLAGNGLLTSESAPRVDLPFRPQLAHSPRLSIGQRYLLFIAYCENGPKIVGLDGGAIAQSGSTTVTFPDGSMGDIKSAELRYSPYFDQAHESDRAKYTGDVCGYSPLE